MRMKEAEAKDDEEKYKEERRREYLFTTKLDPAIMVVRYQHRKEVAETRIHNGNVPAQPWRRVMGSNLLR